MLQHVLALHAQLLAIALVAALGWPSVAVLMRMFPFIVSTCLALTPGGVCMFASKFACLLPSLLPSLLCFQVCPRFFLCDPLGNSISLAQLFGSASL